MPLTYSIAYGLIAGIGCWTIMQTVFLLLSFVGIEKPVFYDPNEASTPNKKVVSSEEESADAKEEAEGNVEDGNDVESIHA
jgi:xanthine/uracil/vitamin C permease (AzgA family)